MLRHLPNAVTASRGLLGPVVAWLLLEGQSFAAFWAFLLAICTDLVDGFLARLLDARSSAGLWLDPLADKLLTDSAWAALWAVEFCPPWLAAGAIGRDLVVAAAWALGRGRVRWSPTPLGQTTVAFEGVALCVLIFHGPWIDVHWPSVGTVLGAITLSLSVASLIEYAWKGPSPVTP